MLTSKVRPNNSFNPTGISKSLIENLPLAQLSSGGLIRAFGAYLLAAINIFQVTHKR
jgi:hypothetical protein